MSRKSAALQQSRKRKPAKDQRGTRPTEVEPVPEVETPAVLLQHIAGNQALNRLAHNPDPSPAAVRAALPRVAVRSQAPGGPLVQRIVDAEIDKLADIYGNFVKGALREAIVGLLNYNNHMHSGQSPSAEQVQQLAEVRDWLARHEQHLTSRYADSQLRKQGAAAAANPARPFGLGAHRQQQQASPIAWQIEILHEVDGRLVKEMAMLQQYLEVQHGEQFERATAGTLYKILFGDGWEAVWKQDTPQQTPGAEHLTESMGIDSNDTNMANRNIALYRLDQLLGTGVIPRTERASWGGKAGTVMELVHGHKMVGVDFDEHHKRIRTVPDADAAKAAIQRGLSNLQLLDAIAGQTDRHSGNVFLEVDRQGNVLGIKGIDNDLAFGQVSLDVTGESHSSGYMGMPKFVDQATAQRLVHITEQQVHQALEGLLLEPEIKLTIERFRYVKRYCWALLNYVRTHKDSAGKPAGRKAGLAEGGRLVGEWNQETYNEQMADTRETGRENYFSYNISQWEDARKDAASGWHGTRLVPLFNG